PSARARAPGPAWSWYSVPAASSGRVPGMATTAVAIVTGAGSGIGRATVRLLATEGVSVIATDRNADGRDQTAAACAHAGPVRMLVQDVGADDAPKQAVDLALETFGRLDWLVNNAGIGGARAAHETDDAGFDRFLAINIRSVFRFSREAVRVMAPGAGIVNLA